MKNFKKLFTFVLCVVLITNMTSSVVGSSKNKDYLPAPPDALPKDVKSSSATKSYSSVSDSNMMTYSTSSSSTQLSFVTNGIEANGNDLVSMGSTDLTDYADLVGYKLYYQYWDGYGWINYDYEVNEETNFFTVAGYHHLDNVPSDRYYRVRTKHYFEDEGTSDYDWLECTPVYVE